MSGWVGVDGDGTLWKEIPPGQEYDPTLIGEPVPEMVRRIKQHLANGDEVRILTARASTVDYHTVFTGTAEEYLALVTRVIQRWCVEHIGVALRVTAEKDYRMKLLYDDRAHRVVRNRGMVATCMQCADKEDQS